MAAGAFLVRHAEEMPAIFGILIRNERGLGMSEYQYYEFVAVDRPLSSQDMSRLRSISTRARITPVSFTNEYQWGDLKANPTDLMERYFDLHVYVANWGSAVFMARLPKDALTKKVARTFSTRNFLDVASTASGWILTWSLDESEDYDPFGLENGEGWMARLAPIREELLRGDLRSLYIGWLRSVAPAGLDYIDEDCADRDKLEPVGLHGLAEPTAAQVALAEFLEMDLDLLRGAGVGSPVSGVHVPLAREKDDWLSRLPREEALGFLRQILDGNGTVAERTLRNRFAEWWRETGEKAQEIPRRTVGEILANAMDVRAKRLDREREEQVRLEAERLKKRLAYLESLAKDFPAVWKTAERQMVRGTGAAYDETLRTVSVLLDAYELHSSGAEFLKDLKQFMAGHMRRKAMVERIVKAGMWDGRL